MTERIGVPGSPPSSPTETRFPGASRVYEMGGSSSGASGTYSLRASRARLRRELVSRRGSRLDELASIFDLEDSELAELLNIEVAELERWRSVGIPSARRTDVDRFTELAYRLLAKLRPERLPGVVRTPDRWLDDRTILQVMRHEGVEPVYEYLLRLFAYQSA